MWPLDSNRLRDSLLEFLGQKLDFPVSFLDDLGVVTFKKAHTGLRSSIKNEYMVTFELRELHDAVRSSAKKLAGHKDSGMRLDAIPLMSIINPLQ